MTVVEPGRLVVLDEPTNDVDPVRRRLLWEEVRALADAGCTVVLVTHNVTEAERAVDRIAVLDEGKVAAIGTPASLKHGVADELRLEIVWEPSALPVAPPLKPSASITSGRRSRFTLHQRHLNAIAAWAQELRSAGQVEEFSIGPATLEDVYIELVGRLEQGHDNERIAEREADDAGAH
jgi:ABC-2 type transport system ATP-binding protein